MDDVGDTATRTRDGDGVGSSGDAPADTAGFAEMNSAAASHTSAASDRSMIGQTDDSGPWGDDGWGEFGRDAEESQRALPENGVSGDTARRSEPSVALNEAESTTETEDDEGASEPAPEPLAFDGMSVTEVLRAMDQRELAGRFIDLHGHDLRVVAGTWWVWAPPRHDAAGECVSGGHWLAGEDGRHAEHLADQMLSELRHAAHARIDELSAVITADRRNSDARQKRHELISQTSRISNDSTTRAVVRIAKRHPTLAAEAHDFDADPYVLNCANGTIDLRNATLRPHRREDRITHRAPIAFDPDATCPTWHRVLDDVFCGDLELTEWFHRAVGYSITGDTSAQQLFFLYGSGSNGKSTVTNTLRELLGPGLFEKVKAAALMASATAGHAATPEVAKLRGARVALASELPASRFDEATIKDIVGEDDITARYLNANPITFRPTHKLWMFGNHRPSIAGTDDGIWRRMKLVPFNARFEGDAVLPDLPLRLAAEMPGILAWAVAGAVEWQRSGGGQAGLGRCAAVDDATADYRSETDTIGEFISEMCVVAPDREIRARDLYRVYKIWASDSGHGVQSMTRFGLQLEDRGFTKRRSDGIIRVGIDLNSSAKHHLSPF